MPDSNKRQSEPEASEQTTTYEQEAERIASLCEDFNNPEHAEAYYAYCDALDTFKAGRVWTPERVRKLYPIMKEIADEVTEDRRADAVYNARFEAAKGVAHKLAGLLENEQTPQETREAVTRHVQRLAAEVGVTLATPYVLLSALPHIAAEADDKGVALDMQPLVELCSVLTTRPAVEGKV
ncbi:MAG: hypothetical protein M3430_18300 [Acidobacteriota bacterium]|nr:hypothetical protein [Acidobacteriota bacterium]